MMTYVLLIIFGGGFASGSIEKIGRYSDAQECETARSILIAPSTPLKKDYVLCVPVGKETK